MSVLSYLIFVLVAVLAFLLGGVGAYFYYRAKHEEAARDLAALKQDLNEQEEGLRRLQDQFNDAYGHAATQAPADESAEMSRLRAGLEEKTKDYDILKQDFDVEINVLRKEVELFKLRKASASSPTHTLTDSESSEQVQMLRARESKLSERERGLADREQGLSIAERELAGRREDLSAQEQRLTDHKKELARRDQERTDREQARASETQKLTHQAQKLTRLTEELAERERQVVAREGQIEAHISSRLYTLEQSLVDRERRVQDGLASIIKDQEMLVRARSELAKRESRLDDELLGLPNEKFTSRQEAVLIKRLKHQNMLQRNELEQVKRQYHRMQQHDDSGGGEGNDSSFRPDSDLDDVQGDSSSSSVIPSLSTNQ